MEIMFIQFVVGGLIAALTILFLFFKLGQIRRILCFDVVIDIIATIALAMLFSGTFVGMMIALVAGFIVSVALFAMKQLMGYERLTLKGWVPVKSKIHLAF